MTFTQLSELTETAWQQVKVPVHLWEYWNIELGPIREDFRMLLMSPITGSDSLVVWIKGLRHQGDLKQQAALAGHLPMTMLSTATVESLTAFLQDLVDRFSIDAQPS